MICEHGRRFCTAGLNKPFLFLVMNAHGKDMAVQEQPSSYISNMMLPAKVKATRDHPLGPDCVISNSEITDKDIL